MFFRESDAVARFIRALQSWFNLPETGTWNLALHDAVWGFIRLQDPENAPTETPWGVTPQRYNYTMLEMLDGVDDRQTFDLFQGLLQRLGFGDAATSFDQWQLWCGLLRGNEPDKELFRAVMTAVDDTIRIAEKSPPPDAPGPLVPGNGNGNGTDIEQTDLTPSPAVTKKWPTWAKVVTGVGVAAVAGGILFWLWKKSQERKGGTDGLGGLGEDDLDGDCGCGG